jgi:hypothetical protein
MYILDSPSTGFFDPCYLSDPLFHDYMRLGFVLFKTTFRILQNPRAQ